MLHKINRYSIAQMHFTLQRSNHSEMKYYKILILNSELTYRHLRISTWNNYILFPVLFVVGRKLKHTFNYHSKIVIPFRVYLFLLLLEFILFVMLVHLWKQKMMINVLRRIQLTEYKLTKIMYKFCFLHIKNKSNR